MAHSRRNDNDEAEGDYKSIHRYDGPQKAASYRLHEMSGVPVGAACGLDELKVFQRVIPDYQIVVYSKCTFNEILYAGPQNDRQLYLYHYDDHYDVITSMPAFLEQTGFCPHCLTG